MKFKRVMASVLTAAMAVSLAACGNSASSATGSAASGAAASTAAASTAAAGSTAAASTTAAGSGDATGAGALIATADASKLPAAAKQRAADTVICGTADLSGIFNPFYAESNEDQRVGLLTVNTLCDNDDQGKCTDGAAKLAVSDDGLTYTYTISDKDKFSDGTNVTAQDYVNYFNIVGDKSYDGALDLTLVGIKGYDDYKAGKADSIEGVKAVDDKTLQITLTAACSDANYQLGSAFPVSTKAFGNLLTKGDLSKFKALDMKTWVGNGAYTLKDYTEKQSVTMTANPNYMKGESKIKNLIFKVVATGSELQALETGEIDIDEDATCNQDDIDEGTSDGFLNMWQQSTLGYGYVGMNEKNPLFADVKVRQALTYGLDRQSVIDAVYGADASVINIPQAKVSWLYDDTDCNDYKYDPAKAASLLKDAGWELKDGKLMKDGKQMKIMFTAMQGNPVTDAMIPLMIDAYGKLGIDFQAEYVDWPTLSTRLSEDKLDMWFMAWGLVADPDISQIYASRENGGGQNYYSYSNPDMDALFKKARTAKSDDELKATYKEIYKTWNNDIPAIPVYQRCDLICYNSRLQNVKISPYRKWWVNITDITVAQ